MIKNINEVLKHILSEDLTSLKNQYYKDMDDAKFQELVALDPTYRGGQQAGNYARWILNMYLKGTLKEEDFYKVTENLEKFDRLKRQLQNKDIFQFKYIRELEDTLNKIEPPELSARQQQRQSKKQGLKDADLVYEDNDWEVYVPKSYEASCALGSGTSWCTATGKTDTYYNRYSEQGDLYIIISKHDPKEKYQFHFESGQFMNRTDRPIDYFEFLKQNSGLERFFDETLSNKELQLKIVKQNGILIYLIKNPSEEVQLEAVKQNGLAIQFIKNPSLEFQLEAVKQNGHAIKYIKKPSLEVQLEAVKQDGHAIKYIKNPSLEFQLEAVKQDGHAIKYIKNPSLEFQLEAVKNHRSSIQYIKNPYPEVVALAKKMGY